MSPNEPLPIFLTSRYFPPTWNSARDVATLLLPVAIFVADADTDADTEADTGADMNADTDAEADANGLEYTRGLTIRDVCTLNQSTWSLKTGQINAVMIFFNFLI